MKRLISLLAAVAVVAAVAFLVAPAQPAQSDSFNLLVFNTMHGVPRPYTGAANPVRNVPGGGLPWVLTSAQGVLNSNGHLVLRVKGLVLDPNDQGVINSGNAGKNPFTSFRAIVSCLSVDAGAAVTANVTTPAFPATAGLATDGGGNAFFEGTVSLPSPCLAPIVFVTNPAGTAWFAVTGN